MPAHSHPAPVIEVHADETSELELDLGALAEIEVSITELGGAPEVGPVRVFLGIETEAPLPEELQEAQAGALGLTGRTTGFARPPHRLRLVSPGDYVVELSHPRPSSPARIHVRVEPGATPRVAFTR